VCYCFLVISSILYTDLEMDRTNIEGIDLMRHIGIKASLGIVYDTNKIIPVYINTSVIKVSMRSLYLQEIITPLY
jgi:hypothetical protein